ncbi:MAG: thiamine diphosphokinase [Oscillospiraceae bacterium]
MEKRCIIVSGGRPGPAPQPQPGDFVIACDRGYRYCAGLGLQPDLFIGDFDSYDGAVDPAVPVERLQPEKDDTDTGHAIRHALDQGYRTLILVCALGGRLDHTLANIQNAASAAAEGANVTILDEREEITFLTGGTLRLPRRKGWGLSVFSLTDRCTGVCLRGVKYRLEDAVLTNRVPLGVSNEFAAPEAEISLTQGIFDDRADEEISWSPLAFPCKGSLWGAFCRGGTNKDNLHAKRCRPANLVCTFYL